MTEVRTEGALRPEDILTTAEACRLLGVTRPTLYSWIRQGRLAPWKRLGRGATQLFRRSSLAGGVSPRYSRRRRGRGDRASCPAAAPAVLLLSSDEDLAARVASELKDFHQGFLATDRPSRVIEALRTQAAEVVVIDLEGPRGDAGRLIRSIRRVSTCLKRSPPAVMLLQGSGTPGKMTKVLGAWDLLRRPLHAGVVAARVKAAIRRRLWTEQDRGTPGRGLVSPDGAVRLDPMRRSLESGSGGLPMRLTRKESELLALFLRRPDRLFSKRLLLELVWGCVADAATRTVDCHIKNLRRKLGAQRHRLETFYGLGYRFIGRAPAI